MKFAQDIVLAPVITENSMAGIADKKYTFKVAWYSLAGYQLILMMYLKSVRKLKNCL